MPLYAIARRRGPHHQNLSESHSPIPSHLGRSNFPDAHACVYAGVFDYCVPRFFIELFHSCFLCRQLFGQPLHLAPSCYSALFRTALFSVCQERPSGVLIFNLFWPWALRFSRVGWFGAYSCTASAFAGLSLQAQTTADQFMNIAWLQLAGPVFSIKP